MPPIADKHLEERILKAALRLWRKRGEDGLTLRAVAEEADTTTPTLYKRFRNKEALRLALAYRFREELTADLLCLLRQSSKDIAVTWLTLSRIPANMNF